MTSTRTAFRVIDIEANEGSLRRALPPRILRRRKRGVTIAEHVRTQGAMGSTTSSRFVNDVGGNDERRRDSSWLALPPLEIRRPVPILGSTLSNSSAFDEQTGPRREVCSSPNRRRGVHAFACSSD
ncbi:hypothetical protein MTO96_026835 [Rhipicephalus appendiculatus]